MYPSISCYAKSIPISQAKTKELTTLGNRKYEVTTNRNMREADYDKAFSDLEAKKEFDKKREASLALDNTQTTSGTWGGGKGGLDDKVPAGVQAVRRCYTCNNHARIDSGIVVVLARREGK